MPSGHDAPDRFQPVALVAAAILPGLGHVYLGYHARGLLIAAGVLAMFFSGLLIGGIDSVDSREDRVWFIGQALVGPVAFAADHINQTRFKAYAPLGSSTVLRSPYPDESIQPRPAGPNGPVVPQITPTGSPPSVKSIGRANELGTLFSAIAGMMNLLVIIDAAFNRRREDADHAAPSTPGGAA